MAHLSGPAQGFLFRKEDGLVQRLQSMVVAF